MNKPKLKTFLTLFPVSETSWALRGAEDELWRLHLGAKERALEVFTRTLPYLNGAHTVSEIIDALAAEGIEEREIQQLLDKFEASSLLEEGDDFGLDAEESERYASQLAFFSRFSSTGGARYQAQLGRRHVGLVADGRLGSSALRQLGEAGIGRITVLTSRPDFPVGGGNGSSPVRIERRELDAERLWEGDRSELPDAFLVALDAEDPALFEAMDDLSKAHELPWMPVRAFESVGGTIGPLFLPGETACYRSMLARLRSNLSYFPENLAYEKHLRRQRTTGAPLGGLHPFFELLSSIAVIELIKLLTEFTVPHLAGRFMTVNLRNWSTELHDVLRVPNLGLDAEPKLFPWKEVPYEDIEAHRSGIHTRRS